MRSRVDIVAVDIKTRFGDLLQVLIETGYSRLPIYVDELDNIKGILFIKDLLPHFHKGDTFRWQSLIRPPFFVPVNKKINDLLEEFQQNKMHLAIVVDEYGGTSGLVTMEDILEEIVGEIGDESDEDEKLFSKVNKSTYIFEAKILLNDFCKIINIEDDSFDAVKGESETLAGLILELKGEIPDKDEVIQFKGFTFKVLEVDQRKISSIQVILPKSNED
jgi:CBS domain containing-hemolysin-like protein